LNQARSGTGWEQLAKPLLVCRARRNAWSSWRSLLRAGCRDCSPKRSCRAERRAAGPAPLVPTYRAAAPYPLDVSAHPNSKAAFAEGSGSKCQHGLRGIFFAGSQAIAIHFEKQGAKDKAGALVSVDEGVIADDTGGVGAGELYRAGAVSIGVKLLRPSEA